MKKRAQVILSVIALTALSSCEVENAEIEGEQSSLTAVADTLPFKQEQALQKNKLEKTAEPIDISKIGQKLVDVKFKDATLFEVKNRLEELGIPVDFDPSLAHQKLSFNARGWPVEFLINDISRLLAATVETSKSHYIISAQPKVLNKSSVGDTTPSVDPSGYSGKKGSLSKEVIRKVMNSHIDGVKQCYLQLLEKEKREVRMTVTFVIEKNGSVQSTKILDTDFRDEQLETCMMNVISGIQFPAPEGDGFVIVSYPFNMTPPGDE